MRFSEFAVLTLLAGCLLAGCRGSGRVVPAGPARELAEERAVGFLSPVAAICADGHHLLALEASGARVLRLDTLLVPVETIPLTRRPAVSRGIAADRFYIYVHDDNTLYRMPKDAPVAVPWLNNVRVTGLASYSTGEMLVADGDRGVVWYKTLFGDSRRFLDAADIERPGAMAALPGGQFAVLARTRLVLVFNRAGIETRRLSLETDFDLLASDAAGTILVGSRAAPEIIAFRDDARSQFRLPGDATPRGIALLAGRLVVLDGGNRLVAFRLP